MKQAEDGACGEALRWECACRVRGTRPCDRKGVSEGKSSGGGRSPALVPAASRLTAEAFAFSSEGWRVIGGF